MKYSSTLFILNPTSHEGQASTLWNETRKKYTFLPKEPLDITTVDIEKIIIRRKPKLVVIAGGDGTINMVCNILMKMKTKPLIGILPDKKVTLTAKASSLVIANCPVIGQNYMVAPDARMNDGLLDCTLFSTKYAYVANLRLRGFKHPFYTERGKVRFKASHIRIEGEPFIQIDGDPVVQKEGITVNVVPSQLTFLRNSADNINQLYLPFTI